jgi:hypothetical protein
LILLRLGFLASAGRGVDLVQDAVEGVVALLPVLLLLRRGGVGDLVDEIHDGCLCRDTKIGYRYSSRIQWG